MGRKEKIALTVIGGIIFLIAMSRGYGIWAVAGAGAFWWYWRHR